jgi:site-specific DNA recombinase
MAKAHPVASSPSRNLRCAVYTRKSSEEGLEQSFNSLHAQRDACEAYIASQKHEGWRLLPAAYDDGGLSGGSIERPSLKRLMDEVRRGGIDVVVVYKVDRLTRSLADFAKLTELFDRHGTSFVSVTQQFNTSTSMGRLTLNVLLSFAQFEREVAGERIRDKIALSKRRGMWMGGLPPLGYDGVDRRLVINKDEAERVRLIFRRYLELGSVAALKRFLDDTGVTSKRRTFRDGRMVGGVRLSRGAIYQILRNRLYRGEIEHRGEVHRGKHEPIVDEALWTDVQASLRSQSQRQRGAAPTKASQALLIGIALDEAGNRLTPTYATKNGRRYRYYVSAPMVRGRRHRDGIRVPAADIEGLVVDAIASALQDSLWASRLFDGSDAARFKRGIDAISRIGRSIRDNGENRLTQASDHIRSLILRVVVGREHVRVDINRERLSAMIEEDDLYASNAIKGDQPIEIIVPARVLRFGKEVRVVAGDVTTDTRSADPVLVKLVSDAHRWFADLRSGRVKTLAEIAKRDRQQVSHVSRTIALTFLAPDIVEMILAGRQPISLTPERLKSRGQLPMDWAEQRALLLT